MEQRGGRAGLGASDVPVHQRVQGCVLDLVCGSFTAFEIFATFPWFVASEKEETLLLKAPPHVWDGRGTRWFSS